MTVIAQIVEKSEILSIIFFWKCAWVQQFWEQVQMTINDGCPNSISVILNENIILFGHDSNFKSDNTLDLIILRANLFIYKCKVNRNIPQLYQFKRYLKTTSEADKCTAKLNMSHNKLVMNWLFYITLVEI